MLTPLHFFNLISVFCFVFLIRIILRILSLNISLFLLNFRFQIQHTSNILCDILNLPMLGSGEAEVFVLGILSGCQRGFFLFQHLHSHEFFIPIIFPKFLQCCIVNGKLRGMFFAEFFLILCLQIF